MDIRLGTRIALTRVLTQDDLDSFARLSGDDNPIHVDPAFSARTRFGKTVAHGMLLYSLIHGVLIKHFPGAVQVSQDLLFPAPTFCGDQVTVSVRVVEVRSEERLARLEANVVKSNGEFGCQGETVIRWVQA